MKSRVGHLVMYAIGFRVQGLDEVGVGYGSGFRVQGLGFRV